MITTMKEELEKLREITDVLTSNRYLVDRTREWEFVLDAMPALVHIIDTNFKIKFVNESFLKVFGGQKEDFIGVSCSDVFTTTGFYCIENFFMTMKSNMYKSLIQD